MADATTERSSEFRRCFETHCDSMRKKKRFHKKEGLFLLLGVL